MMRKKDILLRLDEINLILKKRGERKFTMRNRKADLLAELNRAEEILTKRNARVKDEYKRYKTEMKQMIDDEKKISTRREIKNMLVQWRVSEYKGFLDIDLSIYPVSLVVASIKNYLAGEKILADISGTVYTLSDRFLRELLELTQENKEQISTSDEEFIYELKEIGVLRLFKPEDVKAVERANGAFFPYLSLSKYPLQRQQVFNRSEELKTLKENCLIYALMVAGVSSAKINRAKLKITTRTIPRKDILTIAECLDIKITVKTLRNGRVKINHFEPAGEGEERKNITIGLINDHYFYIEPTKITKYAFINNLEPKMWDVINKEGIRKKDRYIDTFNAVRLLVENKHLISNISISKDLFSTTFHNDIDYFESLNYDYKELKPIISITENEYKQLRGDSKIEMAEYIKECAENHKNQNILFFDFETITDNIHMPFCCNYVDRKDIECRNEFNGFSCGLDMLNQIVNVYGTDEGIETVYLYAHNAGYDYRFLIQHLNVKKLLRRGSGLLTCSGSYTLNNKTVNIIIKDTYKIISKPLKKFGKMFKLNQSKEVMPYSLQTEENIRSRFITLEKTFDAVEFKGEDGLGFKTAFLNNCENWGLIDDGYFDLVAYASKYCFIDCVVLCRGFDIFNSWIEETTQLSIYNFLTIPSLVHEYFILQGCYDGVYQLSGVVRAFIQKCVVGGRVMLRNNEPVMDDIIRADFDAVSLYPSAMARMDGFLLGRPKVLRKRQLNYDFLRKQSGYFVHIRINAVNIKRGFPLISSFHDGVRVFSNECRDVYIDKIALEDLIRFQDVEFEVLKGYYFNSGHNPKINEVIRELFNERLKKKEEENPIQEVYKLIMNSAYGKTLLKPIDTQDVIINTKLKKDKYVKTNFHKIIYYNKIYGSREKYIIRTMKPINTHFNVAQVGVEILSMSKRIMNEVMTLAEDNGINIDYQDTDSLHMPADAISKLRDLFSEKYDRELIGSNMGQFHSDFELDGCVDVLSKKFIGLGKKCYLDILEGKDEKTGEVKGGLHIRMKSIPTSCIHYTAEKYFNGSVVALYEYLFKGEALDFDLLEGGKKCKFRNRQDISIETRKEFERMICFASDKKEKIEARREMLRKLRE